MNKIEPIEDLLTKYVKRKEREQKYLNNVFRVVQMKDATKKTS